MIFNFNFNILFQSLTPVPVLAVVEDDSRRNLQQQGRVASPTSSFVPLSGRSFLLHEHHHQSAPSSNFLPFFNQQQQTTAVSRLWHPQQPLDFGVLLNLNGLPPTHTKMNTDPPEPSVQVPEKQLFLETPSTTADMTVADSNNRPISFSNPVLEFRPVECPTEGFFRNPEDCTRYQLNMMIIVYISGITAL
jgi:hypothetical protein